MKLRMLGGALVVAMVVLGAAPAWAVGDVTRDTGEAIAESATFSSYDYYEPPKSLVVSPDGATVYVMADTLLAFDAVTLEGLPAPAVQGNPDAPLAISPDGAVLYYGTYVETEDEDDFRTDLHALELATGAERTVQIEGGALTEIVVSPDGATVFVAAFNGGVVSRIDAASLRVTGTVGGQPGSIAIHPDGWLYLADYGTVSAVDPESFTPSIWASVVGDTSREGLAVSEDGSRVFVASADNMLGVYDARTLEQFATMEVQSMRVPVLSADDERLFVGRKGTIVVIDVESGTLVSKIPTPGDQFEYTDIAAHPTDPDLLYAVRFQENVYDGTRLVLIDVTAPRTAPFPWWIVTTAVVVLGVAAAAFGVVLLVRWVRSRPPRERPVAPAPQPAPVPAAVPVPAVAPPAAPSTDPAWAAASDPATPLETLAHLAYTRPELRAAVAANPSTYDGLLDWLAQFHDPGIDAAIAARKGGAQ